MDGRVRGKVKIVQKEMILENLSTYLKILGSKYFVVAGNPLPLTAMAQGIALPTPKCADKNDGVGPMARMKSKGPGREG